MEKEIIAMLHGLHPEFDYSKSGINFVKEGMVNSLDIITLIGAIEEKYHISIGFETISVNDFVSIEAIEAMIRKNQ
jgi:acyl carrier protein